MSSYVVKTLVGTDNNGYLDGVGTSAGLTSPQDLCLTKRLNRDVLFFTDGSNIIRQVDLATKTVSHVAGYASFGAYNGDGAFSTTYFSAPTAMWYHPSRDELYVSDTSNHRVRRLVFSTQMVQTVVGTGSLQPATTVDSPGTSTNLYFPVGLAGDTSTNKLYLSDCYNEYIKEYDIATGMTKNIAGGGVFSQSTAIGDNGPATSAYLYQPFSLWKHNSDLYITEQGGGRIRKLNLNSGIITTVAGYNDRMYNIGYYGDGGDAREAWLYIPNNGFVDSAGKNIYFADRYNNMIRKIDINTNIITRFAGEYTQFGYFDYIEGVNALNAYMSSPTAVVYDTNRDAFYVSDSRNNRIRMIVSQPNPTATPTVFRYPTRSPTIFKATAATTHQKSSSSTSTTIYIVVFVVASLAALAYRYYVIRRQQQGKVAQEVMTGGYVQQPGIPQPYQTAPAYPQPTPVGQQTFSTNQYSSTNGGGAFPTNSYPTNNYPANNYPTNNYPTNNYPSSNLYSTQSGSSYPHSTPPYNTYASSQIPSAQPTAYSNSLPFATATVAPASTPSYGGATNTNNSYGYSAIPAVSTYPGPVSASAATYGGFAGAPPQDPHGGTRATPDDDDIF